MRLNLDIQVEDMSGTKPGADANYGTIITAYRLDAPPAVLAAYLRAVAKQIDPDPLQSDQFSSKTWGTGGIVYPVNGPVYGGSPID